MNDNERTALSNAQRALLLPLREIDAVAHLNQRIEGLDHPAQDLPMRRVMLAVSDEHGARIPELIDIAERTRRSLLILRERTDGSVSVDAVVDTGSGLFLLAGLSLCRLGDGSLYAVPASTGCCIAIEAAGLRLQPSAPASAVEIAVGRRRAAAEIVGPHAQEAA